MKNNRNTILLTAGIMQIVKSVLMCILLVVVSVSIEIIDSWLRVKVFLSSLYAYNSQAGEKLVTLIIVLIFVLLGIMIILNAISGYLCIDQSKLGTSPLTARRGIMVVVGLNFFLFSPVSAVLMFVALVVDKNQPEPFDKNEIDMQSVRLKNKIEEAKKLKESKDISKQEFLDMVTKILVEDE